MAGELSIVVSMAFSKGGAQCARSESISVDVAGDAFTHQVQLIGEASEEVLVVGGAIGTPGYILIKNLDADNTVSVGLTAQYAISLKPGEVALFRAADTIYAKATTADCNVEYWVVEL